MKLFVARLLLKEMNQGEEMLSASMHIKVNKGGLSCLPQTIPVPPQNPSARSIRGAPCHASELWDESLLSTPGKKGFLSASPGGIPSQKPLSGTHSRMTCCTLADTCDRLLAFCLPCFALWEMHGLNVRYFC